MAESHNNECFLRRPIFQRRNRNEETQPLGRASLSRVVFVAQRVIRDRRLVALLATILLQLSCVTCLAAASGGIKWYPGLSLGDVCQPSIDKWRASLSQPWSLGGDLVTFSVFHDGKSLMVDR